MKINDFLQIILNNDYSVYASGNIGHEQVRVSVDSLAFSLCIKPTSSTSVKLEMNYTYRLPSKKNCEPTLEVDIAEIKTFMDAISEKKLIDFYEKEKWNRNNIEESKKLIQVFKNILEEKPISSDYSFTYVSDDNFSHGVIELIEMNTFTIHMLDFEQFYMSSYAPRTVKVCTDNLPILINVNCNDSPKYNFKIPTDFTFNIPAYDIAKYPLLKEQNDFNNSHNHTEFNDWLKDVMEYPYTSRNELKETLSKHLLNESLNNELNDKQQIKPKIKI